jgi:hypothetical protein
LVDAGGRIDAGWQAVARIAEAIALARPVAALHRVAVTRPVGHQGRGVRAALTPAAAVGQPRRRCSFLVRAHHARALLRAPISVLAAGPGVMMVLEINTARCKGRRGGAHRCHVVETRLLKGRWAPGEQDGGPSGIARFGGE